MTFPYNVYTAVRQEHILYSVHTALKRCLWDWIVAGDVQC